MAFMQRMQAVAKCVHVRPLSTSMAGPRGTQDVQKAVLISQSNDAFTNLAMEEWLSTNLDCRNLHVMLYYRNDPCVVLGKAGNPWLDVHHGEEQVSTVRRQTDAGTQYHDQGLMNFTFFGQDMPQSYNLGLLARAMFRKYGFSAKHSGEHLTFYDKQIAESGAFIDAANPNNSYQNCTLMVDVDKKNMNQTMGKDANCSVMNLNEVAPLATCDGLLSAIGWEFMRTTVGSLRDGGEQLARQQRGFQMINPTDEWFPGLKAIRDRLVQWDWRFGNTPTFSIFRTFQVPSALLNNPSDSNELRVKLDVEGGRIADVSLVVPPGLLTSGYTGEAQIITDIRGEKFSEEALKKIEHFLGLKKCHDEREKFVTECVKKAMVI